MTGGALLGLILVSMAWLFFIGGLVANYAVLRRSRKAKPVEALPSGLGFMPGVVGSLAVFFTLPAIAKYGVDVPWPWLWIGLPLVVDPYCVPGLVLLLSRK
jgi:MFS-type transporter involved in bile tolerance (Atg22 family)